MVGTSGFKNGRKVTYYTCSWRLTTHDCDQAYMRDECVEEAILEDVQSIFKDDALVSQVCEEVNKLLAAEGPEIERQLAAIDDQIAKAQQRRNQYFEAFEAKTLSPRLAGNAWPRSTPRWPR